MKKLLTIGLVTVLSAGCSATLTTPSMQVQPAVTQQTQATMQANSLKGIYNALKEGIKITFEQKDKNKDGALTPDEFGIMTPDDFKSYRNLDDNWDGKLSLKEMTPGLFSQLKGVAGLKVTADFMFNAIDMHIKDAKVTKQEVQESNAAYLLPSFDKFDKGGKGSLTKSEFEDLYAAVISAGGSSIPNPTVTITPLPTATPKPTATATPAPAAKK